MKYPLLAKAGAIALVMLLLSFVLLRIDGLVHERRWRQQQARIGVEQSLASAQTLLGPLLQRRCVEEWEVRHGEGRTATRSTERREMRLEAVPERLQLSGDLAAEPRRRGLFKVNGWLARLTLQARFADFAALQPRAEHAASKLHCDAPQLLFAVSDVRGLRTVALRIDGEAADLRPGTGHPRFVRGLHAVLPAARADAQAAPLAVTMTLDLLGTARFALVPAATQTTLALRSPWPHPSFGGRFLPTTRAVGPDGFDASWSVSSLASSAAVDVLRNGEVCAAAAVEDAAREEGAAAAEAPAAQGHTCLDTLAVTLVDPVNPYVLADRATKYALLFIVLTFACVALTEVLAQRRVHAVQYLLVGLALALFFLLLLSLSEHVAFDLAYGAASAACVALLGYYAAHMLASRRAGAAFGAGIAVLYGVLWTLLQMEQNALVIGSLLLFGALAAAMVLTRRVDWHALFAGMRQRAAA